VSPSCTGIKIRSGRDGGAGVPARLAASSGATRSGAIDLEPGSSPERWRRRHEKLRIAADLLDTTCR
jgi:hypothetical protein